MGHEDGHAEPKECLSSKLREQSSLKQEILQLEKRLDDQFVVRGALEMALGSRSSDHDISNENSTPKPAKELIKEIAVLELEVVYLEQYLLSLYREAFDQKSSDLSPASIDKSVNSPSFRKEDMLLKISGHAISSERENFAARSARLPLHHDSIVKAMKDSGEVQGAKRLLDSGIHRSHSSLCYRSACSAVTPLPRKTLAWKDFSDVQGAKMLLDSGIHRSHSSLCHRSACSTITPQSTESQACKDSTDFQGAKMLSGSGVHRSHSSLCHRPACSTRSPPRETLSRAVRACHSQPLSLVKRTKNGTSDVISLAELLGTCIDDHVPETPNRISEDMIKCMSEIYFKLAEPPLMHNGLSYSPISSLTSGGAFSPMDQYDVWSPGCRKDSSFEAWLENPFCVEGLKDFSGPYSTMVEIPRICRDNKKLNECKDMLQNFRSLVSRLEKVDPRKMKHEEKLAFWINVHNALVMHAFLTYGIPQNNMKRLSLYLKAAYKVGSHTISADTIQNSILGCRMPRPGQWYRLFFPIKSKFKAGDDRKAYAIEQPEPLLHFGLCSGSHSDPAVRVYTPKRVLQELEAAKEEYIRATYGVRKEQKIILPKIVECYAKDTGLSPASVVEMIRQCMPESLRKTSMIKFRNGKTSKIIEWVPHNFAFRYLISRQLMK